MNRHNLVYGVTAIAVVIALLVEGEPVLALGWIVGLAVSLPLFALLKRRRSSQACDPRDPQAPTPHRGW